jgi:transcriptional regulator with XRE-family HTH domain
VTAEEVRTLRRDLRLTAKQLASALEIDSKLIFAWESGDRFPTKQHVERMKTLAEQAAGRATSAPQKDAPLAALDDPRLWAVVRKLTAHPELLIEVERLAAKYEDPTRGRSG